MDRQDALHTSLGTSILGGAACGLSYEGALRDAMAREDLARREAGRISAPQAQPSRVRRPEPAEA